MKEILKPDFKRGFDLLNRLLRLYPFDIHVNEQDINAFRTSTHSIARIIKTLWIARVFNFLDQQGYQMFEPYSGSRIIKSLDPYHEFINDITIKVVESLEKITKKPKKDIYLMTRDFMKIRYFFSALHWLLAYKDDSGGWALALGSGRDKTAFSDFYALFGFSPTHLEKVLWKSDSFISQINEILKELGYEAFSLSADGKMRYFGVIMESEEKRRVYDLLSIKKYDNVIEDLDKIYEHVSTKNYSDALANCRKAQESFFKRFLLNHNINLLHDGKNTEDGMVSNLAETLKQNMTNLFDFPNYSKNFDTKGFYHFIESSKFMISGLANQAGSHGKSNPPNIDLKDVKAAISFLILMINMILPFEK